MVLAIHAESAQSSKHPPVRQRLRPGQIDFVLRRPTVLVQLRVALRFDVLLQGHPTGQ